MSSGSYAAHLAELVRSGEVDEGLVDDAVRRILTLKFRLGLFERPYVGEPPRANAPTAQTREVARAAAEAACWCRTTVSCRWTRPRARCTSPAPSSTPARLLGTWTLDGRGEDVVSPAAAFRARLGAGRLLVTDGRFSDRAVQQVRNADVTVALLGEHLALRRGQLGQ